jgi:Bifunctional DNA primase/polymerase, N-terminal/Protein of unknown function (DUF3987)
VSRAEAALGLARAGWLVFPCHHHAGEGRCSCGHVLCNSPAKHPRTANGLKDASSDPAQVMAWWAKWPDANVGIRTGGGTFVVDVDGEAGWEFLKEREVPATLSARTGRGVHLYFYAPEGVAVRNRAKVGPELDVRGDGGYVLAPPSEHASGAVYEWVDPEADIAEAPGWLVELVREREVPERPSDIPRNSFPGDVTPYARAALEGEVERVLGAVEGSRNDTLNTAAFALGQLVAAGALPESATEALRDAALAVGLGERETDQTLRSGLEAGKRQPRDIPEPRNEVRGGTSKGPPRPSSVSGSPVSPDDVTAEAVGGIVAGPFEPEQRTANGNGHLVPARVEYPLGVWPGQVAEFIEATAHSVCVAPEAVGTCVLAVAAGAIGHARWLAVKDDWVERPGIYAGLVAASGERKSPAIRAAAAPLEAIQAEHIARWKREVEEWESTPGRKGKPELSGPLMKDVTTEAVAGALMSHPRGVILLRDELVGLVRSFGQYKGGKGDDRQKWLEAWGGGTMLIRRRGSDPIAIEHPCLSVLGGIQPAVFDGLRAEDDGLAERFLYDVMPTVPLRASTPAVSRQVRGTWEAIVRELYRLSAREVACEAEGCLTEARQRALDARAAAPRALRSYFGKGEAHLARLAVVLATVDEVCGGPGVVTGAVVERAEMLWGFYADQAQNLFCGDVLPVKTYTPASPDLERAVVRFLEQREGSATKRDVMRGPLNHARGREAEETLAALLARGTIRPEPGQRSDSLMLVLVK